MLGEEFDKGGIRLAIMRFGAEIDGECAGGVGGGGGSLEDFFLRAARFDGDLIFHTIIITRANEG